MHRCLFVHDIITEIAWHVRFEHNVTHLHSVAALAQTCHALYEPAMDVLWHTLHSVGPVVKCLPEDFWYEERGDSDKNTQNRLLLARRHVVLIRTLVSTKCTF